MKAEMTHSTLPIRKKNVLRTRKGCAKVNLTDKWQNQLSGDVSYFILVQIPQWVIPKGCGLPLGHGATLVHVQSQANDAALNGLVGSLFPSESYELLSKKAKWTHGWNTNTGVTFPTNAEI